MISLRHVGGIAALCLCLAGCGPSVGAKASAASATSAPSLPPTKPMSMGSSTASVSGSGAARKLSVAGVLLPADLPGYTQTAAEHDPMDDSIDQDLQRCLGVKGLSVLSHDYGVAFHKGDTEVDTSAEVVGSAAVAGAIATAAAKRAACFENQFAAELESSGVSVVQMSVTPVRVDVPDADEAFAFHVVATAAGPGGYEPIDAYSVDAVSGRTEATVTEIVSRGHAPALTEVGRLAGLAVTRIRAVARST